MRLVLGLLLGLWAVAAHATCGAITFPFTLTNGTLADANQVMSNFNLLASTMQTTCAGAGSNNDITALNGLTVPITPAQGGSNVYIGGATTGSANVQTLSVANNFSLIAGNRVSGVAGFTNTNPTTLAINVGSPVNFYRKTQLGPQPMAGGELIAGNPFLAVYTGSVWVLEGEVQQVGEIRDWAGTTAPPGWQIANGASFVCTTFPALCTVLGTQFGGTASNPLLPDLVGRATALVDPGALRLAGFATVGTVYTQNATAGAAVLPQHMAVLKIVKF